ncbi:MAG: DNA polymerase III subunit alpha [bacterium]|nr:DNA polymerase III subunit alpha [bacterium]
MPSKRTPFIHLHTHSHYSLLDGLSKIGGLVKRAKSLGMPAMAITDHGNMYGAIEFYKKATSEGIKPIIGVEAYVAARTRFDKSPGLDARRYHLTLLAKNHIGYKNLIKLVTSANLEGYYYKPRMDRDLLRQHHEGVIALSGCMGGELSRSILDGDMEHARQIIRDYQDIFGVDNYFLELMHHPGIPRQMEATYALVDLGKEMGIGVVGTQDSHYLVPDDSRAHATLLAVQTGTNVGDSDLFAEDEDFSFIDTDTAYEHFSYAPDAVENTFKIAESCNLELELGKWVFPNIALSEGSVSHDAELRAWVYRGIDQRDIEKTDEVVERIEYELKIIFDKGYSPYFLVVGDLIRFAREKNILTNIRGSVAGSIVTYLIGITNVDPIKYNIPFERFLNPFRPSAPDIDMDYADNRREEMIQYAVETYGADKVAQIGTFGTMMAKGSVKDVARALGYPYAKGDMISSLIPLGAQGAPMTIEHAMDIVPELTQLYDRDPETKEIIDLAKKMEGCVRHVSVHAAGVVMAPSPLTDFAPIQFDPRGGKIITQYNMYDIEETGLLKFDFLGITNLSILGDAIECVQRIHGVAIDLPRLPVDDQETFEMLARGETMGLFQLNGAGMTRSLKDLKPTSIHDINLMVALYRPGPIENINEYIARKNGERPVVYPHPAMKKFLEPTYGVLVYQDDLLMTAIEVAGYTWEEVDKFRKAVGKKIPEEMAKQHTIFVEGCQKHGGLSKQKSEEIWQLFEPFQGYGFNKAHAASYGLVAYWTAYMKAHFPAEYMTAVLTAESNDSEKVMDIIQECRRMGIEVLAPDINESNGSFTVLKSPTVEEKDKIRFGLMAIKNVGAHIVDTIVSEREEHGTYTSLENLLRRIHDKDLNKKSLESFIRSGAFDCFGDRSQMFYNVDGMLAFHKRMTQESSSKQANLFGTLPESDSGLSFKMVDTVTPIDSRTKLAWEKELLGLYISAHPLDDIRHLLDKFVTSCENAKKKGNNSQVRVSGIVTAAKKIYTKTNEPMLFVTVEDLTDTIEVIVFPSILKDTACVWDVDKIIAIDGKLSLKDNDPKIICSSVKEVNDELIAILKSRSAQDSLSIT